ncbi:Uncharacterised protein [Enterococcus hirae]|nr:Uncharacterised protein [Enterococcus hirae]VTS69318.1 Uncharacterised protein [Enterococcus hirae]
MKKFTLGVALLTIGSIVLSSTTIVYASENS